MFPSYLAGEDLVSFIEVRKWRDGDPDPKSSRTRISAFGPHCAGCKRHRKAMMLSLRQPNGVKDVFLDSQTALKFISSIRDLNKDRDLMPVVISFEGALDKRRVSYVVEPDSMRALFDMIRREEEEILLYANRHEGKDSEASPVREAPYQPPTPEQRRILLEWMDEYYKTEPHNISFSGTQPGLLLASLFNNAGDASNSAVMTPAEGQHIWDEVARVGKKHEFDYINGKPIKCRFSGNDVVAYSGYGHSNEIPITACIALAKRGVYLRAPKDFAVLAEALLQTILKSGHEKNKEAAAEEVMKAMESLVNNKFSDDDIESMVNMQRSSYRLSMVEGSKRMSFVPFWGISRYQVSLVESGEIGPLIKPFIAVAKLRVVAQPKDIIL